MIRSTCVVKHQNGAPVSRDFGTRGRAAAQTTQATYRAVRHDQHPMGRSVDLAAPNAVPPPNAPITNPGSAPDYSVQTGSILAGLSFESDQIDAMMTLGEVSEKWSPAYFPE